MRNVPDKFVEEIKTHILYSVAFFFSKIVLFMRKCGKNFTARQVTENNMAHAHCVLDTQGYKYAHSVCVIIIPVLKLLYERPSILRYTHIACLVFRKPWSFDSHCTLAGTVNARNFGCPNCRVIFGTVS